MIDIQKMKKEALEALDNMDDYARMAVSIEPIGALNHLTDFINTVCARLESAEENQVIGASARQFKQMEERLEAAEQDAARWNHLVNSGYGWIDIWKDKYKTSNLITIVDENMKESK